jgi:UDP-glucose:(heptosyl)LPS alpha-1,3-glucosyltransferase
MRIGIVVDDLDRRRGGMSEWCWQFVNAASKFGHDLEVVAQGFGEALLPARVTPHVIARTKSRFEFAHTASQVVGELGLDVVHDMGLGWNCDIFQPHGGSYAAWTKRRLDVHPRWYRTMKRAVDAWLPRQRDFARHGRLQTAAIKSRNTRVVAISNFVADCLVRLHGIHPDRITTIYNGIDCRRFSPEHRKTYRDLVRQRLSVRPESTVLLIAAHNFRLKGVPELLRAAGRLITQGRPVHVLIAGGKHLGKWRNAADRIGLVNRASFLGAVDDMAPLYAAADAYVHPTYYDPCSLVLLEAAACGLPIITTRRFNGAAELFREGEILTIGEPTDGDRLYECIEAVCDERLRQQLGASVRQVALRHTFERNVAEILWLYGDHGHRQLAA